MIIEKRTLTFNRILTDLACRNCLVARDFRIRIADFGLSRDVSEKGYFRSEGETHLPIRWMAPEALMENRFDLDCKCNILIFRVFVTLPGDIWSFGVVLWEIFSFGLEPYSNIHNNVLIENIITGHRLARPNQTPEAIYNMMMLCWGAVRPTFGYLAAALEQWAQTGDYSTHLIASAVMSNIVPPTPTATPGLQAPSLILDASGQAARRHSNYKKIPAPAHNLTHEQIREHIRVNSPRFFNKDQDVFTFDNISLVGTSVEVG